MFAIFMAVALGPAVATLIWLDRKAKMDGMANMALSNPARHAAAEVAEQEEMEVPSEELSPS